MFNDQTITVNDNSLNYSFSKDILIMNLDPHQNQVECLAILSGPNRTGCFEKEMPFVNFYYKIMFYKCAKKNLYSLAEIRANHDKNQDLYSVIEPKDFNLENIHNGLTDLFKKELEA